MSKQVTLVNKSDERLHFPHIGPFEPKGTLTVSEEDAEILLRNKALAPAATGGQVSKIKGTSQDRSMKGIERD